MTTPADLLRDGTCSARCLLASTSPDRCRCPCRGLGHQALRNVDITALIEARRRGLHHLADRDLIEGIA